MTISTFTWEQRRALTGLIEAAETALQTAQAICPGSDEADERVAGLVDTLFAARGQLAIATDLIGAVPAAQRSGNNGGSGG